MESLSHPFHRRKLSNATGKNAYDGIFSGRHRQKFEGAVSPAVNVDEYREIFSAGEDVSSIPVLDLSDLDESSDCLSSKPDYGIIFGGFRDLDIAVSYEELVARDNIRDPSSTNHSSQDLGDESHQSSDALKQFNMSYNKISQRSKNGLDGTTHVAQLQAVPGFTCFIDESASQPKKETVKQNSSITYNITNNVHPGVNSTKRDFPEKPISRSDVESRSNQDRDDKNIKTFQADVESPAVSQPKKRDFDLPEKQTSWNDVESGSGYGQYESLSGDTNSNKFQSDLRHPSKVSSTPNDESAFQPKNEPEKQNSVSNDINLKTFQADLESPAVSQPKKRDFDLPEKQTSWNDVESGSGYGQYESLSGDTNFNKFQSDLRHPSKVSSTPNDESAFQPKNEPEKQNSVSNDINLKTFQADLKSHPSKVSATNLYNHKDYQKRSPAKNTETFKKYSPNFFDEEGDVNSAASVSAAALRKAIEKAQESIRIAKESVGRKDGLRGFSNKSFKDSLKVKRRVQPKEKDDSMKTSQVFSNGKSRDNNGGTVVFTDFADGEKVINEIHGKILESDKKYEIPLMSSFELRDDKIVCKSKEDVIETEAVDPGSFDNSTYEDLPEDNLRPDGFLVFEKVEEKVEDIKEKINDENNDEVGPSDGCKLVEGLNKLTVYEKAENDKKIPEVSDQNGYEKRFGEVFGFLENKEQEVHEQEHDEIELKEKGDTKTDKEEDVSEKFYDVCEVETVEKENSKPEEKWNNLDTIREPEIYENSSSSYDDAEESESVHSSSHIVIDTHDIDDESSSDEKEIFKNIYVDQTISEDEDDDLSNRGFADVDFGQNEARSESSSDTIHGMEIEIKEYKEREETIVSEDEEEEEINLQPSQETLNTKPETTEIGIKTETGTSQEPKDEVAGKPQIKSIKEVTVEEREQERIKLAVERAIREARERAFIEARERAERAAVERATAEARKRVMADAQERSAKSFDKTSAQSKLRAERAAVERATAEARQRALEKAMSQKITSEPKIHVNEIKQTSSSVTHTSVESALRSKAKLEKHNRIMERAAKALAEKEKRDLIVLKEQAERSRISENLDADIKRWSSGKEGNLRALLSTLQYILGAESGWQAVSLTEIITASAVKKAYRKATLCVHPDKLQQRGASIQQKYICEKVFDLLKDTRGGRVFFDSDIHGLIRVAWNRFNSEER